MGLFRRWFGGAEQRSDEAVAGPAAPDTLEQRGRRNAASDESAKSDIERGEDAHPAVTSDGGLIAVSSRY